MKTLTRRDFLHLTVAGLGALAGGHFLTVCSPASVPTPEPASKPSTVARLATGRTGMVTGTSNALAIQAGAEVLRQEGSAMDAALVTALGQIALTAGAAISYAGILGMMYYDATTSQVHSMNAAYDIPQKETMPRGIPRCGTSGRTVLVPGFMAGVQAAHDRFGKLPFEAVFKPAIDLAEEGFRFSARLGDWIAEGQEALSHLPETKAIFTKENGEFYAEGDWFRQPELAKTLRAVASEGADYMYEGPWAEKFVELVRRQGGKIVLDDLVTYKATWPEPVQTTYGEYQVYGPGLPASGGVAAIEAFKVLETADLKQYGHYTESPKALFWSMQILSHLASSPSEQTAAVVTVDQWGNVAAVVHSCNTMLWGKTGIFVDGVSIPDSACLQQREIMQAGAGNRLPDGLNPLIVLGDGKLVIGSGAVGGLHCETMQRLMNILDYEMDLETAMNAPTFFQGPPMSLTSSGFHVVEGRFDDELLDAVKRMGLVVGKVPEERQTKYGRGYWTGVVVDLQTQNLHGGAPGDFDGCAIGY